MTHSRYASIGVKKGKYYILNYYRKDEGENSRSRFANIYQKKKEERAALANLCFLKTGGKNG